jgi:hypothetical protein
MVGRVTEFVTNDPLTLHFTSLLPDGSAYTSKRLLADHQKTGGVIRLWPDDAVTMGLGLGEGIETALTLALGYTPVWAAVDSGNLGSLPVVGGIESLVLAEDGDDAGRKACSQLARRWREAGREVVIIHSADGEDLNDV